MISWGLLKQFTFCKFHIFKMSSQQFLQACDPVQSWLWGWALSSIRVWASFKWNSIRKKSSRESVKEDSNMEPWEVMWASQTPSPRTGNPGSTQYYSYLDWLPRSKALFLLEQCLLCFTQLIRPSLAQKSRQDFRRGGRWQAMLKHPTGNSSLRLCYSILCRQFSPNLTDTWSEDSALGSQPETHSLCALQLLPQALYELQLLRSVSVFWLNQDETHTKTLLRKGSWLPPAPCYAFWVMEVLSLTAHCSSLHCPWRVFLPLSTRGYPWRAASFKPQPCSVSMSPLLKKLGVKLSRAGSENSCMALPTVDLTWKHLCSF